MRGLQQVPVNPGTNSAQSTLAGPHQSIYYGFMASHSPKTFVACALPIAPTAYLTLRGLRQLPQGVKEGGFPIKLLFSPPSKLPRVIFLRSLTSKGVWHGVRKMLSQLLSWNVVSTTPTQKHGRHYKAALIRMPRLWSEQKKGEKKYQRSNMLRPIKSLVNVWFWSSFVQVAGSSNGKSFECEQAIAPVIIPSRTSLALPVSGQNFNSFGHPPPTNELACKLSKDDKVFAFCVADTCSGTATCENCKSQFGLVDKVKCMAYNKKNGENFCQEITGVKFVCSGKCDSHTTCQSCEQDNTRKSKSWIPPWADSLENGPKLAWQNKAFDKLQVSSIAVTVVVMLIIMMT
ncbi:hypothetical protein O181_005546 [Austropuccinia psidii MF-1]|uniref:Uncharacterized protein n=1 Tax=Austropuccinia psidii MF-1 TaxID=1389203 RepID=A0A9Q3BJ23_9BASI|nr:hypothetical protein [Austropuccinia psidii MF-1]